jgi:hypothetical protein
VHAAVFDGWLATEQVVEYLALAAGNPLHRLGHQFSAVTEASDPFAMTACSIALSKPVLFLELAQLPLFF